MTMPKASMAASSRPSRTTALWILIFLSTISHVILTAVILRIATFVLPQTSVYGTALAAAIFNFFNLVNLFYSISILFRLGPQSCGKCRLTTDIVGVLIFLVGILLTVYTLSWSWVQRASEQHRQGSDDDGRTITIVGFVFWALDAALQSPFHVLWILPWTRPRSLPGVEDPYHHHSPARSTKRSVSLHLAALPPPPAVFKRSPMSSPPISPTISSATSTPRSSIRYSMTQVVRPITSRTRLLLRQSSTPRDSRSIYSTDRPVSIDTAGQDDGFGSWDTSAVEDQYEGTMTTRVLRSKLEPIPQSRPVSPARALEGPFTKEPFAEDIPLPESPLSPTRIRTDSLESIFRSSPTAERRGSGTDESHIHPLFRSNNPSPTPPLVSPGTIITASPLAGQVMSRAQSSHGSRPGSPSPLFPALTRASSYKSLRQTASSPTGEALEVPALPSSRSRSAAG